TLSHGSGGMLGPCAMRTPSHGSGGMVGPCAMRTLSHGSGGMLGPCAMRTLSHGSGGVVGPCASSTASAANNICPLLVAPTPCNMFQVKADVNRERTAINANLLSKNL